MRYDFYFNFKLPTHSQELRSWRTPEKCSSPWICQCTLWAGFPGFLPSIMVMQHPSTHSLLHLQHSWLSSVCHFSSGGGPAPVQSAVLIQDHLLTSRANCTWACQPDCGFSASLKLSTKWQDRASAQQPHWEIPATLSQLLLFLSSQSLPAQCKGKLQPRHALKCCWGLQYQPHSPIPSISLSQGIKSALRKLPETLLGQSLSETYFAICNDSGMDLCSPPQAFCMSQLLQCISGSR